MRRRVGPVLGLLLGGILVLTTSAERSPDAPSITLQEARPNPILPAALIPFTIGSEVCRNDHLPRVTLKVYDGTTKVVATLTLRGKAVPLDGTPMRCGDYVAAWDGTVNSGRSVAVPAMYFVRLEVDQQARSNKIIVPAM
jgi:hypothetical protein